MTAIAASTRRHRCILLRREGRAVWRVRRGELQLFEAGDGAECKRGGFEFDLVIDRKYEASCRVADGRTFVAFVAFVVLETTFESCLAAKEISCIVVFEVVLKIPSENAAWDD